MGSNIGMERFIGEIHELKEWQEKFITEHEMWKNEVEAERKKLIIDYQQKCLLNRILKDE